MVPLGLPSLITGLDRTIMLILFIFISFLLKFLFDTAG